MFARAVGSAIRRPVRAAVIMAVVVGGVLIAAAFAYEHIAAWQDARVLQQVGRSVDVGGRTLNIHCTGEVDPPSSS